MNRPHRNRMPRPLRAIVAVAALLGALAVQLPVHATPAGSTSNSKTKPQTTQGVVNLNTATSEELQRLPSVGPARAEAILKLRKKMGGFERAHHLLRVRGIGRKTFRKLRPMLTLDGETTLTK